MNLQEKIDFLMKKKKINKRQLAIQCGLSYGAIDGIFKVSFENMKLTTFKALCSFFGVTMDSMARDEKEIEYGVGTLPQISPSDADIIRKYHKLNRPMQNVVMSTLDAAYKNSVDESWEQEKARKLKEYEEILESEKRRASPASSGGGSSTGESEGIA